MCARQLQQMGWLLVAQIPNDTQILHVKILRGSFAPICHHHALLRLRRYWPQRAQLRTQPEQLAERGARRPTNERQQEETASKRQYRQAEDATPSSKHGRR